MHGQGDNPLWYRVAALRPRLVAHAQVQKQAFRGDAWYVLHNLVSGRSYRFTDRFYHFVALLDGKRSVGDLWQAAREDAPEDCLTQDEIIEVLGRLYMADVLQTDCAGDAFELFDRQRRQRHAQRLAQAKNPLGMKVPLFDPNKLLDALLPLGRVIFSLPGLGIWLLLVAIGVIAAATSWSALLAGGTAQILSPQNLLLLGLCYPVVKVLHELGHGLATKVWGGEVHQVGLMLLAFIPLPYIDASAANTFPEKHRRMIVSAAGIMVETFLAVLALFLWLSVEPGVVRSLAYNVMLIGSVSTLFINGNPLLRFDAYYVLVDAISIPNLSGRSTKYLGYLIKRYGFGVRSLQTPATHDSERGWLGTYGVLAWLYRILIMLTIAMFVAEVYPTIGTLFALWAITTVLVWPVLKHGYGLFSDPSLQRQRGRAVCVTAAFLTVAVAALFAAPAPHATITQGVVAPPKDSEVRANRAGTFRQLVAAPDTLVTRGQPLIETTDAFLPIEIQRLEAQLRELKVRRKVLQSQQNLVEADILDEELQIVATDLQQARDDVAALTIVSPANGMFLMPAADDLPGRFVQQGDLLGYVADLSRPTVRVAVRQADIGLVKGRTRGVTVRLAELPELPITAEIVRQVPGALDRLPSAALGARGGGPFAIDPEDTSGTRPVDGVFEFELRLPVRVQRLGGRTYVRFDHGHEPFGQQLVRRLRQLFLSRFNV